MLINTLSKRFDTVVWSQRLDDLLGPPRWGITAARLVHVLVRDLSAGNITMRAMGLVYTSLLSLVPLLALAFSLLKAFGMDNALRPMLERFLAPLGERADPLVDTIIGFVANVQVGVLGIIGLVVLLYSVISLIQKIEVGCNAIWQVRSPRTLGRRFTEYLSVLLVGPLVLVAAMSMTASLSSTTVVHYLSTVEPFGTTLYVAGHMMPYVMYSAAFTFLYAFMPNTQVRILPALGGGVFAGVLWQTASLVFTTFAANAGNVNAVYSSFAILILLLIWLYISWLIMLTGCRVAFLLQHPEQLTRAPYPPPLSNQRREELALLVTTLVAHNFMHGYEPWRVERLARHLRAVPAHIYTIVDRLVDARILLETGQTAVQLMPRQDIDQIKAGAIVTAIRQTSNSYTPCRRDDTHHVRIDALMQQADQARNAAFGDLTLRDLAVDCADSAPTNDAHT